MLLLRSSSKLHAVRMMDERPTEEPTLKTLRDSAGLTQPQLSTRLNVNIRAIAAWERGEYLPSFERAIALAKELGVSLKTLARSMQLDVSGLPDDQPLPKIYSRPSPMAVPKDESPG